MNAFGHNISIIPVDNIVVIDGLAMPVDCKSVAQDVHAVIWHGSVGEIEFIVPRPVPLVGRPPETITSMEEYAGLLDAWDIAKAKAEENAKALAAMIAAQGEQAAKARG
jgi:hypothetical protein